MHHELASVETVDQLCVCVCSNGEVLTMLLSCGADINATDSHGRSVWHDVFISCVSTKSLGSWMHLQLTASYRYFLASHLKYTV